MVRVVSFLSLVCAVVLSQGAAPIAECVGCKYAAESITDPPAGVTVTVDWGSTTAGECKVETSADGSTCTPSSGCTLDGVVVKATNTSAVDWWARFGSGWALLTASGSLVLSPDDGMLPCGHAYTFALREKKDESVPAAYRLYLHCLGCDWASGG